ncbi:receptor-type tyrosine-protein phosphatase H-like [Rana temporaria]|uniref:receptor-type tyrosine-protein phosphatase H-like n=1 Tax=Rana temporaria TaxID=8407 RepID=UPI001AADA14A|nr:receptor-type tyrosine-protein phosphatase H-like [Rana temporaria]
MAFHYIIFGRTKPGFLLLAFIICFCRSRVIAQTDPANVSKLQAIAVNETTIFVQWEAPPSITDFKVLYTNGSADGKMNVTNINCTIVNLLSGENYNITVYSVNGTLESSGVTTPVTTLPSVVVGLTVTNISGNSVTISWKRSNDINARTYTYNVTGEGPGFQNMTDLGNNSIIVHSLLPGTDYNITVYAVTENKISSRASEMANATTLPSVVKGLIVSNISTNQVTVSWMESNDPNNKTYTYTVELQGFRNQTDLNSTSTVVSNLEAGSDYKFKVYAVTKNEVYGRASDIKNATTLPSVVKGLFISNISTNEVTVSWMESNDPNNKTYTYTVEVQDFKNQTDLNSTSTVVSNLKAGSDYNFKVYAVTKNGDYGRASDIKNATTLPSEVKGLIISNISTNNLTVSWLESNDPNNGTYTYTVEVQGFRNQTISLKNTSTVVSDLTAGSDYDFIVYAVTKNDVYGPASDIKNVTTLPSIVPTFAISSKTNQSVILNWRFPENVNVVTYTYTVEVTNSTYKYAVQNINNSFTTVENLLAGETYNFTIYTVTINNVSSFQYPFITDTTMPNEPHNLAGNITGITEIVVYWTPPKDVHTSLYEYNVAWTNVKLNKDEGPNTTSDTQFTIKSLFPGNLYRITVQSVFRNTTSENAVHNFQTNPVSTQNFKVNTTNTTATLQWDLPFYSNSNVDGYRVIVLLNEITVYNNTTEDMKHDVPGLKPGYIYEFSVESFASNTIAPQKRSLNQMNSTWISYSTPQTTTKATVPDPVQNVKCSKVDGYRIRVEFQCPVGNYSEIQVVVNDKSYNCNCTRSNVISGLQPAKGYMVKVVTLGTDESAVTDKFECYTDSTGVIVGSVLGILLFLLLIGLIVYFVFKMRRSNKKSDDIYIAPGRKRFHTISKERFKQHYENNHANSDFGFAEEYQELSSIGTEQSKREAELPENRAKNRFTNVLPYDHSRIKLTIINESATTDYINANFMPGYNSTKEFIASQGPLPNTTADFWRMIWEHHVNTIVMLTNCMENGRVKCERYWPLDYTPCTYGDITVTVTSETILPEWTTRDFSVKHAKQSGVQTVRHFHFTAWPDHGVPDSTLSIIQFRNLVRENMDQRRSNGPTVVHCSAGVGRTGTLIALDYLIQQMEREHRIGIYSCVEKMRMNRSLMVQTEEQYIFLNKCMLDLIDQSSEENVYENQVPSDLIYENATVVRNFQKDNA